MSDARESIEVRGTSVSPLRTSTNSVVEHVSCTKNYYSFVIEIFERSAFFSLSLPCTLCVLISLFDASAHNLSHGIKARGLRTSAANISI